MYRAIVSAILGLAMKLSPVVLLVMGALVLSCSGGSSGAGASCLATGSGLRFLLASQDGISESQGGIRAKPFLSWSDGSYPLDPALSPNCGKVAFALQPPATVLANGGVDFGSDLYVANRDGSGQTLLLRHQAVAEFIRTPAWLSETDLLYTVRGRTPQGLADFRIERMNVAGGRSSRVVDWGVDPAISRDYRQVAYVAIDPTTQEETLTLASADFTSRRPLVTATSKLALFSSMVFSPDGTRIAFAAVDLTAPPEPGAAAPAPGGVFATHPFAQDVWIVNTDGSGLKRLAEIAENMPSLTWSGDGAALYAIGPMSLWRIDPQTGRAEAIGAGVPLGQIIWLSGP